MSVDLTDSDEVTSLEHINDGCIFDEVDLVDLSCLDLENNDHWLYMPLGYSSESEVKDLYTWLRTEPNIQGNKKYIDTRTFTRSKKRPARMSFESVFEGIPHYVTNVKKPENQLDAVHMENVCSTYTKKCSTIAMKNMEAIPLMLKPSIKTAINALDENSIKSGQESMEVFLNMSESKGIDSFINLGEPEFSDPLMNVSQPSILCASIIASMADSTFIKNNTMTISNRNTVQQVQHNNVQENSNFDDTNDMLAMQNDDDLITLNETYRLSSMRDVNNTFCKAPAKSTVDLNKTYDAINFDEASVTPPSFDKEEMSRITTLSPESSAVFREAQNSDCNFDMPSKEPINQSTPIQSNMPNLASKVTTKYSDQPRQILYSTMKASTSLRKELLAEIQRSAEHKLNTAFNPVPDDQFEQKDIKENAFVGCDETVKGRTGMSSFFPSENRYNTYRKSTLTMTMNQHGSGHYGKHDTTVIVPQRDLTIDRKFYTFTKKSSNFVDKTNENVKCAVNVNTDVRSNLDDTFCKPLPKAPKRNSPRMLSKLPQFLQKSNPNLVSNSLRSTTSISGSTSVFSVEYKKSSQPNIMQNVEKLGLSSKLHPFGKLKSGSEQQLIEVNVKNASEFPVKGATGSTESIESTQSVQSAPDLDDRLSTCSDSTHNSCDKRTMNIEQLHQLVRMQEESLKQDSTTKQNERHLENNWVETKTESPLQCLKNGIEYDDEIDTHLPPSANSNIKCSSPLSLSGSSHALNNEGSLEGDTRKAQNKVVVTEKTEGSNQTVPKVENKTRLRQPTNWGTGSKLSSVISGIPRPASRIPAPRFARPNVKTSRADVKKGHT